MTSIRFIPTVQSVDIVIVKNSNGSEATITSNNINNFGTHKVIVRSGLLIPAVVEELEYVGYVVTGKMGYKSDFTLNKETGLLQNSITLILQKEQ